MVLLTLIHAGKTFLSGMVVDKARLYGQTLFVFLSYTQTGSTSALSIVHSLIFQLTSGSEDLQAAICEMNRGYWKDDFEVAFKILCDLLAYVRPVYIIIDGLDEIDGFERCLLLKSLPHVLRGCEGTKVLLSSRLEADIELEIKRLNDCQCEPIKVDDRNVESIQTFIDRWTEDWSQTREFAPYIKGKIEKRLAPLASKSKGW